MRRAGRAVLLVLALAGSATVGGSPAAVAQRPALLPDATQAVIDGRVAVGYWPLLEGQVVGPEGFTVHLVEDERLETELVFPAGYWFQPPPGRYKVWVEGRSEERTGRSAPKVSPNYNLLKYSGSKFEGRGIAVRKEVGPAGWVTLDPAVELAERQSLRLIHAEPVNEAGRVTRGFLRAVTPERASEPVSMPAGSVVGLLYDLEKGEYVAVSRPIQVSAGGTAQVVPKAERGVSDVLVILGRDPVETAAEDDLELHLQTPDGEGRPPDVLIPTWEWVYALWYDVDGRTARLLAESARVFLDPVDVVLEPGGVATHRGRLRPRPHLDVGLDLPPELRPEAAVLEVVRREDGTQLVRQDLPLDGEAVTRIEGLPAEELWVTLVLQNRPLWKLRERVDLSDGLGRELLFQPRPIVLSGTVYHGGEPAPAEVRLFTVNEPGMVVSEAQLPAEVDAEGGYRAVVYHPGRFNMAVNLLGVRRPEYRVPLPPYIRQDTTLDIHVPRSGVRVRVRDTASGSPIPGALVTVNSEYALEWRDPPQYGDGSSNAYSDEDGWAELPPLHPGSLKVWAGKEGYLRLADPVVSRIEADRITEIDVTLEPLGETAALELVLSDGRPAAGAEVRAQTTAWNEVPLWEGRADAAGRVSVPRRARGAWLLVRHPEAGGWIEGWSPAGDSPVTWSLPPTAGAVRVRTVALDGEPVPFAGVALRLPRAWVAGRALAWLTGNHHTITDSQGLWTLGSLPAVDVGLIAGTPETLSLALQGLIEGSAQRLSPPWPADPVEVTADRRR